MRQRADGIQQYKCSITVDDDNDNITNSGKNNGDNDIRLLLLLTSIAPFTLLSLK